MFANRKRVILDRGPSWPDYQAAEPFVNTLLSLFLDVDLSGFPLIFLSISF